MNERWVYTSIVGGKDALKEGHNKAGDVRFHAFVHPVQESADWEVEDALLDNPDPNRCAKKYKVLAHKYFPHAEYSLWIDGSTTLLTPMDELIDLYLKDHDIALHKHYMRDCAYDEAMVCGAMGLDGADVISKQMARYFIGEKYPAHNGLAECTIILRRHTPQIQALNELWWKEISEGSRRDQLSFNYCCWKTGVRYQEMVNTVYNSPSFKVEKHLK